MLAQRHCALKGADLRARICIKVTMKNVGTLTASVTRGCLRRPSYLRAATGKRLKLNEGICAAVSSSRNSRCADHDGD